MRQEQNRNLKVVLCKAEIVPRATHAEQQHFVLQCRKWDSGLQCVLCFILNSLPACSVRSELCVVSFLHLIIKWLWGTGHERYHLAIYLTGRKLQRDEASISAVHCCPSCPVGLFALLQSKPEPFSISTCWISPLINPWGCRSCSQMYARGWSLLLTSLFCERLIWVRGCRKLPW